MSLSPAPWTIREDRCGTCDLLDANGDVIAEKVRKEDAMALKALLKMMTEFLSTVARI